MRTRRTGLACTALAAVVLVGLVIAGAQGVTPRTFADGAPAQATVAVLRPSQRVCEGPVTSRGPATGVGIWGAATGPTARLGIALLAARTGSLLAAGKLEAGPNQKEWTTRLSATVPGGQPFRVCLTEASDTFSLVGALGGDPHVVSTDSLAGSQFSLVLLSGHRQSLLGSLSTVFSRASLWRPSWVGSWTFWLLAVGLLAAFGLAVIAVVSAASADDSEAGQDRPEPVA